MLRDTFLRIDLTTFLVSLLGGLLPFAMLVVISIVTYSKISDLSGPVVSMVRESAAEQLQVQTSRLDGVVDQRLENLREELRHRVLANAAVEAEASHRNTKDVPGWGFVTGLRWYPGPERPGGFLVRGRGAAEDTLTQLSEESHRLIREAKIQSLAEIPITIQDPMGFSYSVEASLHSGNPRELASAILAHGSQLDRAELSAYLERVGRIMSVAGLPEIRAVEERSPVSPGEAQIDSSGGKLLLLGVANPGGGTLVMEISARRFLESAVEQLNTAEEIEDSYVLAHTTEETDAQVLTYPLAYPFGSQWLLAQEAAPPISALELISKMKGWTFAWFGMAILVVAVFASVLMAMVVSRRVRVSKQKDDFLRLVSHELRTPISSLRLLVDTLGMGRVRDEKDRLQMLSQLGAETDRLSELVERVLEYGRAEGGRANAREVITDPGELVSAAVQLFQERQHDAGEIVVRTAQEFHPVILDRDAVMRVVLNLLSNARKYSAPDLPIEVTVGEESRHLFVEVKDFGKGVPKRDHKRIFRRYYRVKAGTGPGGFGLGLAYCREVAEAHRGKIRVDSTPGKGSTFTFEIPLIYPREGESNDANLGD